MRQIKYYCDHCGKEIPLNDKETDYNGFIEMRVDFRNTDIVIGSTDLCFDCTNKLVGMIKDYLKGGGANA